MSWHRTVPHNPCRIDFAVPCSWAAAVPPSFPNLFLLCTFPLKACLLAKPFLFQHSPTFAPIFFVSLFFSLTRPLLVVILLSVRRRRPSSNCRLLGRPLRQTGPLSRGRNQVANPPPLRRIVPSCSWIRESLFILFWFILLYFIIFRFFTFYLIISTYYFVGNLVYWVGLLSHYLPFPSGLFHMNKRQHWPYFLTNRSCRLSNIPLVYSSSFSIFG